MQTRFHLLHLYCYPTSKSILRPKSWRRLDFISGIFQFIIYIAHWASSSSLPHWPCSRIQATYTNTFQPSPSRANFFLSFQDFPLLSTPLSFILLHVPCGLPLILVPWWFHPSALLVLLALPFLSVCPIFCPMSFPIEFCPLLLHISSFLILSLHFIRSNLEHELSNLPSSWSWTV